jgi:GT2 family glycosyltransferase
MDVNGKFALNCRNEIFKGLHIIFVESGYNNYYFNYAHNCNAGLKKAMEYNPKWIIVSNDDMYKIDPPEKLKEELSKLNNNKKIDFVLTVDPSKYQLMYRLIGKPRITKTFLRYIFKYKVWHSLYRFIIRFNIKFETVWPRNIFIGIFFYKNIKSILSIRGTFSIFNSTLIEKMNSEPFDENYINDYEDVDLSMRISNSYELINYKIGSYRGSSIQNGNLRTMRDIINLAYFNYKYANIFKV